MKHTYEVTYLKNGHKYDCLVSANDITHVITKMEIYYGTPVDDIVSIYLVN